jgi:hypothetical protein
MAIVKKRSSVATAVSKSTIDQAGVLLTGLPEKPKSHWSLREAVGLLQDPIILALSRGYTYEELATLLGERGIKIAVPSLKRYLAAVKQEKALASKFRQGKGRKSSPSAVADSEQPASQTPAKTTKDTKAKPAPQAEPKMAAKKTAANPTTRAKTSAHKSAHKSAARSRKQA